MSNESLVLHSAPTLAGIKTGNLFSMEYQNMSFLAEEIRELNHSLTPKGVRIIPMKKSKNRVLFYVYRPKQLRIDFTDKQVVELLNRYEYPITNPERCVAHLASRLQKEETFPHEIGLFLGYPPEDVEGFIEHKAQKYTYKGLWKVYGDPRKAAEKFKQFGRCTTDYCNRIKNGASLEMLVAF